jgi:serine/threonine protein phosphatase PrpC
MSAPGWAGLTDIGRVRTVNEDRWVADPQRGVYIVSDGMGGAFAGEWASRVVVEALPPAIAKHLHGCRKWTGPKTRERVCAVLAEVSEALRAQSQGQPGLDGMGATAVVAVVRRKLALVAHMGDSRCYFLRGDRMKCLTKDHTIVQLLVESGDIQADEAATHPARGKLTRFVGMPGEALPEACTVHLQPGDRFLLCSDGLTGMLSEPDIAAILTQHADPTNACQQLVAAANAAGGKDNITALIVTVPADQKTRRSSVKCPSEPPITTT